jgi:hypothetical protein
MGDPNEPSLWLILAVGMGLMISFILLLILNHKWATRRRPKSEEEETPAIVSRSITEAAPEITPSLITQIMSMLLGSAGPIEPAATRLQASPQSEVQGFANGCNPVNDELRPQAFAQPIVPEEARDIIIFWGNVAAVERIVAGGKMGVVEAIELIFECKRNGRADSVYGKARAAINARSEAAYRANQARLVELQAAAVEDD